MTAPKRILALFLCLIMITAVFGGLQITADETEEEGTEIVSNVNENQDLDYEEYLLNYGDKSHTSSDFFSAEFSAEANNSVAEENVRIIDAENPYDIRVAVPQDGWYNIALRYMPYGERERLVLDVKIDGNTPFSEIENTELYTAWVDNGEIETDEKNNHVRPEQIESQKIAEQMLRDNSSAYNEAYRFFMTAGEHTLGIAMKKGELALNTVVVSTLKSLPSYEEYKSQYANGVGAEKQSIFLEAETPSLKSDPTLFATYDRSGPETTPSDPVKMRLNTIGQEKFKYHGQWLEYSFEVTKAGLYQISMRVRQNILDGLFCSRRIYIDGEVPFTEMDSVRFPYDTDWYVKTLGDEEPYLFYLEEGTHTLRIEVIPGETAEVNRELTETLEELNYIYRQMFMITGASPDMYRDYDLDIQIPTLLDQLAHVQILLQESYDKLSELSDGNRGIGLASIDRLIVQTKAFIKEPDTIPNRMTDFKDNISALGSMMMNIKEQPLELDSLAVFTPDCESGLVSKAPVFKSLWFHVCALAGSFIEDYSTLGGGDSADITIWCMTGRDQAQIIKDMIDESFTPQYEVNVQIDVVQTSVIEATLAGEGPDIALFVSETDPVFLGSRGILYDVTELSKYEEIAGRYDSELFVPYSYQSRIKEQKGKTKVFGIPLTYSFPMLFYRTDIFESLKLQPPTTWSEFNNAVAVIQNKLMDVGVPSDLFNIMLLQKGGSYYNEELDVCLLDSEESINAFETITNMFVDHSLPLSFDFFNRFRTGEMPMGVVNYTVANQIQFAAPELRGLWGMVPLPGMEDGSDTANATKGSGTAAIVFNKAKNIGAVEDFLDWFTQTATQTKYGRQLEIMMGVAGRYSPANKEVVSHLNWSADETKMIQSQFGFIKEIPVIPSSYYVSRNFTNAFRRVTYYSDDARETMMLYVKDINKEITRKWEELDGVA